VLVTGARGQVGRALLANAPSGIRVEARSHGDLDISDRMQVERCVRTLAPDVIVNAAAYTAVDRAEAEPELTRHINADGPRYLAGAALEYGARLLHISTDFVFDGAASSPYKPEAATHPLSTYGLTKRDGENAVGKLLGERSIVVRTSWVYAAQGHNFVQTMIRLMRSGAPIKVVADQVGTPTSATSLAQALWKLVALPRLQGTHHYTDAGVASWYDFAVAIAEDAVALGLLTEEVHVSAISTRDYPTPARRPAYSVLDTSSLATLGIARTHWRVQLRRVLKEIRDG
jgi:dTDP-4-dehydrorhamnose reductase